MKHRFFQGKLQYIFYLIGVLVLLQACKSSQKIIVGQGDAVAKANQQLVRDIIAAETSYKTLSGKIALEMIIGDNSSGMKVNSQMKIIRDSIIQLSLRAPFINTELFRLDITPSSVVVIDRINKIYGIEDINKIRSEKNIQFNYANIQSLFTNALFVPGKNEVSEDDYLKYNIQLNSGKYHLTTKDLSGMLYDFTVDSADRIISTSISGESKGYSLSWAYSNFIKHAEYLYPTHMHAKVNINEKKIGLVMTYAGLDIDKDLKVDTNIPSKYSKKPIIDIIKSYIK